MSDTHNERANERTPLLVIENRRLTPLPKRQITILLLLQMCEPITSQSIYPYINEVSSIDLNSLLDLILYLYLLQLISELGITGGDEKKVGYYAGLIVNHLSFIVFIFLLPMYRNLCFSRLKPSLFCNGAERRTMSVESQFCLSG